MKKILISFLLISALIGFLVRPVLIFKIEDVQENKTIFQQRVQDDYRFATLIYHSVQLTPVYEYYRIKEDRNLEVTKTVLQDLGWGMPSNLDYPVRFENNYMIMENINRSLEALYFRISYIARPHLILNEEEIDLTRFMNDSNVLKIYADEKPFIIWKLRGEINVFQEKN